MAEGDPGTIPDDVGEAIDHLEAELLRDIAAIEANAPDPLAPVGEHILHGLRAKRLEADGAFIDELRGADKTARKQVDTATETTN
jgi:hypothetical protein